jgi:hypothetical protein
MLLRRRTVFIISSNHPRHPTRVGILLGKQELLPGLRYPRPLLDT